MWLRVLHSVYIFSEILNAETKPTFIQLLYKIRDDLGIGDEYVANELLNTIAAVCEKKYMTTHT